ncbi:MAG: phosphoglycerate dehydrogenase, partial [Bdellovibrionales bacterium]|nr:phosphoglycerate dehydrogenase [Bdellovibrionales bacterium]
TPHIGGSTEEAQENIGKEVADSFLRFINNGSTTGAVNFPQVDLPVQRDVHRVLNVHKNVPGVLRDINKIVSDLGANIRGQFLSTNADIGYLVMDLEKGDADSVAERIREIPTSIKTRILY